jgi:hypothetical protein
MFKIKANDFCFNFNFVLDFDSDTDFDFTVTSILILSPSMVRTFSQIVLMRYL